MALETKTMSEAESKHVKTPDKPKTKKKEKLQNAEEKLLD